MITGNGGVDVINGGGGTNTLVESNDGRFVIAGTTATATLDMGQGTDQVDQIALTGTVTAGTFELQYGSDVTDEIPYNALPSVIKSDLIAATNLGEDDIQVSEAEIGGPWTITFIDNMAGLPAQTLTVINMQLTGGDVTTSVVTSGVQAFDNLTNIQRAVFTAGAYDSLMDASNWTGTETLYGGIGNDTLIGGPGNDDLEGGGGNNTITGGTGSNILIGGAGQNTLVESLNANMTLTDTRLTLQGSAIPDGKQVSTISGFQLATLTGGTSTTLIDASGFTGVSTTTELPYLNGGAGVRTTDGSVVDMAGSESTTQLSTLNNGGGVHTKPGKDLKITLTDGSVVYVALSTAATVADVENLIELASYGRINVSLNTPGRGLSSPMRRVMAAISRSRREMVQRRPRTWAFWERASATRSPGSRSPITARTFASR